MRVTPVRRVLIFAYFFPPLGGAGVQRIVKLAKYLPAFGWEPTVVTVRARDYWMIDASLQAELGGRVSVVRTPSLTGLGVLRRMAPRAAGRESGARRVTRTFATLRRTAAWFAMPDSYVGWVPFAVRAGARLLRERPYAALLTTSSPDSAHLIGRALAQRFQLPWIADFRDPWTQRLSFAPPTAWHRARHMALERSVLHAATRVIVTAPETRTDYLNHNPDLAAEKLAVITNGFDEEDFAPLSGVMPPARPLRILHAGQLNPERPARPFLEGLRMFLEREPAARTEIEVRFIGPHYAQDREDAERMRLGEIVTFEAARTHAEIVRALCGSHLLLLMEHDSARGGLILPGKIFEYLRARRPILALVPRGAAWHLVAQLDAGRCCRTEDHAACAAALADFYQAFKRGGLVPTHLSDDTLAPFERRALAGRWANTLDQLLPPAQT
jgi:glycosyltransferase involved in cell wall biosynthesis